VSATQGQAPGQGVNCLFCLKRLERLECLKRNMALRVIPGLEYVREMARQHVAVEAAFRRAHVGLKAAATLSIQISQAESPGFGTSYLLELKPKRACQLTDHG
jgi:hypothetical protein